SPVFTHCPPGMGVGTTLNGIPGRDLVQSSMPIGVSTRTFFIASATLFLSLGSPLRTSAFAATSKRARLGPACSFHCLPECALYPSAICLEVNPVRLELYGHV